MERLTSEQLKQEQDKPLLHCFLSNGPSQSWKRSDQRRGQLGITTVYGAEFQTEKGVLS